ncbi:MAG: hypothetical protein ACTSRA_00515 [Promethearchaeota archaeon]
MLFCTDKQNLSFKFCKYNGIDPYFLEPFQDAMLEEDALATFKHVKCGQCQTCVGCEYINYSIFKSLEEMIYLMFDSHELLKYVEKTAILKHIDTNALVKKDENIIV